MKPFSPQLLALLQTAGDQALLEEDVYEFDLAGGGVLRYCAGLADLTVNGRLYSGAGQVGPYFVREGSDAMVHQKLGLEVDTLVFDVAPGTATVLGTPFLIACSLGMFDGAEVTLSRIFMTTYGDTRMGPAILFTGRVAQVVAGRTSAQFTVEGHTELLSQPFPRSEFQAGCINSLGDTACGVALATLGVAGAALGGSTGQTIVANLTTSPVGQFDQGKLTFSSGNNSGLTRAVKTATAGVPGSIALLDPFPYAPAVADAFTIYPGCDKTFTGTNGCPKFSNTARFRGFDLIPVPETAV